MRPPAIRTILYTNSHQLVLYAARPYMVLLVVERGGGSMAVGFMAAYGVVQVSLALPAGKWIDKL